MSLQPKGLYYGKLIEIGPDTLDNEKKTPLIYATFQITHRAVEGKWEAVESFIRDCRWWVTEKAEPYTMDRLRKLGFNGDFAKPLFSATPNPQTEGVELSCGHRTRDEQTYEEWDLASMQGGEKERTPWDKEFERRFRAKYRTRLDGERRPDGKPSAPPAAPAKRAPDASPVRDEEIPSDDVPDDQIPF